MKFLVITHVDHKLKDGQYFAYGPYVREMNLWFKWVDDVVVLAPISFTSYPDPIDIPYRHRNLNLVAVPEFSLKSATDVLNSFWKVPLIFFKMLRQMKSADHIHLRCPGNMGLIGCFAQVLFPKKRKTAKYAGNWDPSSVQPFTYKLQQTILRNEVLTKNMRVLVYGKWPNEPSSIYPFFTASYSDREKEDFYKDRFEKDNLIQLIFVGGLFEGKQPILSARVLKLLSDKGYNVRLDFFGEGPERERIEKFIQKNSLTEQIFLHGNVPAEEVKNAFKKAHFLIFISKSEGWPKVVAEAMFWGCLPITSPVSCVPQMVGNGERGELVDPDLDQIVLRIEKLIESPTLYHEKSSKAASWSRKYTLDRFESEIKFLLVPKDEDIV